LLIAMPILKEKPTLAPKPTCGGCDICGDCADNHYYALGRNGKYYCKDCFFKVARDWKKPKARGWVEDSTAFKARWEKGESYTSQIAKRLRSEGLEVVEPERTFRESFEDRKRYRDEVDLVVSGVRIEVKSRRHHWMTLDDFPYPSIFVDTVKKWDGHKVRPFATINVSQKTGAVIVVPGKSHSKWTKVSGVDKDSKYKSEFYSAPRETWATYEQLVEALRRLSERTEESRRPEVPRAVEGDR